MLCSDDDDDIYTYTYIYIIFNSLIHNLNYFSLIK